MTRLHNEIIINSAPEKVWGVLSNLGLLYRYDPVIRASDVISNTATGVGAERKCELKPKGWYKERITEWKPNQAITFELYECTLPVKRLKHSYVLKNLGQATHIVQIMEYELKMGIFGKILNALFIRKKWDAGIKQFFSGLKQFTETGTPHGIQ